MKIYMVVDRSGIVIPKRSGGKFYTISKVANAAAGEMNGNPYYRHWQPFTVKTYNLVEDTNGTNN